MATSAQSLLETFDKKVALSLLLPLYKLCNSNGKSATWSYVDLTQIIVNLLETEKSPSNQQSHMQMMWQLDISV